MTLYFYYLIQFIFILYFIFINLYNQPIIKIVYGDFLQIVIFIPIVHHSNNYYSSLITMIKYNIYSFCIIYSPLAHLF